MRKYMGADGIGPPSVAGTGCFEFVRTPAFSGCGDDICSGRGRGGNLQQQRAMSGTSDLIYLQILSDHRVLMMREVESDCDCL
jgi:hypothetical protein